MPLFERLAPESTQRFTALIYGSPKVGKTTLAASSVFVPEMQEVLVLDSERSSDAVAHFDSNGHGVNVSYVQGFDDLAVVANAFRLNKPEVREINTVIVDTISTMRDNYIDEQALSKERANSKMAGRTEISDFMKVTIFLRNFLDVLIQRPNLNIFVLAHEAEIEGKAVPYMNAALRGGVIARMSSMWYMHHDPSGRRVLEVLPHPLNAYATVGTRNATLAGNLRKYALENAPAGQNPEKWAGTLVVPEDNSLMKVLYDLHRPE